jgi:hypothetical protein
VKDAKVLAASGPDAKNGGKQYSAIAAYLGEKGGTA